jgi:hypothetical protein
MDTDSVLSVQEFGKSRLSRDWQVLKKSKMFLHSIVCASLRDMYCHSSVVLVFISLVSLGLRNLVPRGKLLRNDSISEYALGAFLA